MIYLIYSVRLCLLLVDVVWHVVTGMELAFVRYNVLMYHLLTD